MLHIPCGNGDQDYGSADDVFKNVIIIVLGSLQFPDSSKNVFHTEQYIRKLSMKHNSDQVQEASAPLDGPRSIEDIIIDLSKPVNPRRLKQRKQGGQTLDYIPWYQAVRYLDRYAPGWRYEIRQITTAGENLVMVARIVIPCAEGEVWREASSLERIEDPKRYGDAATNAESAALRRAAAKFGLCLYLYDK